MKKNIKDKFESIKMLVPYFSNFKRILLEDFLTYFCVALDGNIQMQYNNETNKFIIIMYDGSVDSNGNTYAKYGQSENSFLEAAINLIFYDIIGNQVELAN